MKRLAILLLGVLTIGQFTSCKKDNNCVTGSGSYTSRNYSKPTYSSINIYGEADVFVTKSSQSSIRIEGEESILNALNVSVTNDKLYIGEDNCFENARKLKIYLSTASLNGVYVAGKCNVYSPENFSGNSFQAEISGTGTIDINVNTQEFNSSISGDGTINVVGAATSHDIFISGDGRIYSYDFITKSTDIGVSGKGTIETHCTENLDVTISGSCNVYYKGYPTITSNISGLGNIIDSN